MELISYLKSTRFLENILTHINTIQSIHKNNENDDPNETRLAGDVREALGGHGSWREEGNPWFHAVEESGGSISVWADLAAVGSDVVQIVSPPPPPEMRPFYT